MLQKLKSLFGKEPIDAKIPIVIFKLQQALKATETVSENLKNEDDQLFERCIEARLRGDSIHAMMYANECAEIRKIVHLVISSRYALEQMVLRLHTVSKLGSVLLTISPVADVIKETGNRLVSIMPNVSNNLNEVNKILSKYLMRMGSSTASEINPVVYSDDALKILEKANIAAESTIREKFPKIPLNIKVKELQEETPLTS